MKILITGGCGFVGTNLGLYLNSKGFNINAYKIDDPSQIQPILKKCLNSDKPNLIDIQIDGSV